MELKNIRSLLRFTFGLKSTFCDRNPCNFASERQKGTLEFVSSNVSNSGKLEKHQMLMSLMLFALLLLLMISVKKTLRGNAGSCIKFWIRVFEIMLKQLYRYRIKRSCQYFYLEYEPSHQYFYNQIVLSM